MIRPGENVPRTLLAHSHRHGHGLVQFAVRDQIPAAGARRALAPSSCNALEIQNPLASQADFQVHLASREVLHNMLYHTLAI